MELTVHVVCRPAIAAGFRLAGVPVEPAVDVSAAVDALHRLAADPESGIILVDGTLFGGLPDDVRARLERQVRPLVTPFPAPAWDEAADAEAFVLEILRQAIGYRVRPGPSSPPRSGK